MNFASEIVLDRALHNPDGTAVICDGKALSNKDLAAAALSIMRILNQHAHRETKRRALLYLTNGPLAYASMLGCLLAGWTYCPQSPSSPTEKVRSVFGEFEPDIVVTSLSQEQEVKAILNTTSTFDQSRLLAVDFTLEQKDFRETDFQELLELHHDIAYVIYTSGTTGKPKGIQISVESLAHYIQWLRSKIKCGQGDRVLNFSPLEFDLSVGEIFLGLISGSTLVPCVTLGERSLPTRFITQNRISHMFVVPSLMNVMKVESRNAPSAPNLPELKFVAFCGEPLTGTQVSFLQSRNPHVRMMNTYGPAETTVSCTELEIADGVLDYCRRQDLEILPIGWPITGMNLEILDPDENGIGELLITGSQVGKGYLSGDEQQRFSFDPSRTALRSFATGDLAKIGDYGFEFVGRKDRQVKIRGVRIELEEVEAVVGRISGTKVAVVLADTQLVALSDNPSWKDSRNLELWQSKCLEYLRSEAVPVRFIYVESLPLSPSGKLDYVEIINRLIKQNYMS